MKVCLIQNKPVDNKEFNLNKILCLIPKVNFDLLLLPECFNSPYGIEYFKQ